ncbi:helix-turn-helix domain-containing protein [Lysinibacillus cavernae]|uniref:helix-turn-helix domain-containing protein n=1 Tax=Lysinibacillus cavernae TaxID=2666135 RepID=UPI0018C2A6AB|nr:AraC family transcriptional regulator [Lysinibacillus cavernae]
MDTQEIIEFYTTAPLTFIDVITEKISSETVVMNYTTMTNAAGLLFPINGVADVVIAGTNYRLEKGHVIHVGPNLPIQRTITSDTKFEYAVIHFQLSDGENSKFPLYNHHFALQVGEQIKLMNMLQQLIQNYLMRSHLSFLQSKALFLNILEEIILLIKMMDYQYKKENIALIMEYIQENFTKNMTVIDIANHFNMERRKLTYLFEKRMGVSPNVYLTDLRVQKSKMLLSTSHLSVKEIAESVGYTDYFYFSRVFKKVTSLSPSEFRKHMK